MLHEFLTANRTELIARCNTKVALRPARYAIDGALQHGIPQFLDQLIKTLRVEKTADPMQSRKVSGESGGASSGGSEIGEAATLHGRELLLHGFTVDQVVHDYGDLCQAVTELAFEVGAPIDIDEFRTLNRCLDNAIADAVTEYTYGRDNVAMDALRAANERQGYFVHELRALLNTATLSFSALRTGNVGVGGATGNILDRSLVGLRNLVERSIIDVRVVAGLPPRNKLVSLAEFIDEIAAGAALEAKAWDCKLVVTPVDPTLVVDVDRDLLCAALGNLLTNAFKYSYHHTEVALTAYAVAERVVIDVADNCGGLPQGSAARMFLPFTPGGQDRSGLGLGLSIARRSVEANHGVIRVRDVPGTGCVFTIDLPRHRLPIPATGPAPQRDDIPIR